VQARELAWKADSLLTCSFAYTSHSALFEPQVTPTT